ncbi:hypothetical protein RJJ65_32315 [Rhizobium hidalgonense]|uniref:Uncharacterized protein n=1 Tax=Rhizobium hidalgonense TaxID=1538159 RepID=A0AAJ2H1I8_9HYPH|nr:hypothetical protein [Rhizobium hidalgonense]MDR9777244.1 hypothetical protein [Rhizobium hidalgonense]
MNKKRILALADIIEKQPHTGKESAEGFSMSSYVHDCGTPCCIAGWAAWLSFRKPKQMVDSTAVFYRAKTYLGLHEVEADLLFLPHEYHCGDKYPPSQAAATLRHLAETGEVNWRADP